MSNYYFNRQSLQNFLDICDICCNIVVWCPADSTLYDLSEGVLSEMPEDYLFWYVKSLALNGNSLQIEIVEDFD